MPIKQQQQQYSILVTKDGSNVYALRNDGVILSYGTNATTVIQAALNGLTSGRIWKETVKVIGDFTITTITIPSYTTVDLTEAKLTQANTTNSHMISNSDQTNGNVDIELLPGVIDGNKAGNSAGGNEYTQSMIHFKNCAGIWINGGTVKNGDFHNISLELCTTDCKITNITSFDPRHEHISDHARSVAADLCRGHIIANNYLENVTAGQSFIATVNISDCVITNNVCRKVLDTTSGIAFNGLRTICTNNTISDVSGVGINIGQATTADFDSSGSVVVGNIIKNNGQGAIVANSYPNTNLFICNNIIDGTTTAGAPGIQMAGQQRMVIANNITTNCYGNGIIVYAATIRLSKYTIVTNNISYNNAQEPSVADNNAAGIQVRSLTAVGDVSQVIVYGNRCYDNQGTKTQKYGLRLASSDNVIVRDNDFRDNLTANVIRTADTNSLFRGNLGYATETYGTSATQSGDGIDTTFVIPHGLVATPATKDARPALNEAIGKYWVTADATNIIVNYTVPPPIGTNNLQWLWEASV